MDHKIQHLLIKKTREPFLGLNDIIHVFTTSTSLYSPLVDLNHLGFVIIKAI